MQDIIKVAGWMLALILIYLLVTHGDSVTQLVNSGGGFITSESKVLQGR